MSNKKELLSVLIRISIPLILLWFIFQKTKEYFQLIDWALLLSKIPEINPLLLLLMAVFGFVAAGGMIFYDVLFNEKLNLQIPLKKLLKYSWIVNTFNNFFGFGGLTGASIRAALYKKHHPSFKELVKTITWVTPLMFNGVSILLIFVLFYGVDNIIKFEAINLLKPVLWGIILFLPVYLGFLGTQRKLSRKEDRDFVFKTLLVSVAEWLSCFIVFYIISLSLNISASLPFLYSLFFVGKFIGVISMVPGGIGAFDVIIIEGLSQHGVSNEEALLLVLLYRVSYFILPWVLGVILATQELGAEWIKSSKKIWNYSEKAVANLSHMILTVMVFLSGIILLVSHLNQLILHNVRILKKVHEFPLEISAEISLIIGFLLIILSRTIYVRLKFGLYLTLFTLLIGSYFSFSKGFSIEDSVLLITIALLLFISKKNFTRTNYVLSWEEIVVWTFSTIGFISYYMFIYTRQNASIELSILMKVISPDVLILFFFIFLFIYVTYPKMPKIKLSDEGQKEKVKEHLERNNGNTLSHMIYLNDKYLYWSDDNTVLFLYQTIADKIVVLGEPTGKRENISKAIDEFQKYADAYGMKVLFYQVERDSLSMYHDKGYSFFKLGEESVVNLNDFTLSGKRASNLRNAMNKFEKSGYSFEVISPPVHTDALNQLKKISEDWLGKRKEKGFSLGFFDEEYLQMSDIGILKDNEGKIIAFANLTPVYDSGKTLSLDLMRYSQNSPIGTMDVLFCHILQWSKQQNYDEFHLRMAPLSNVGNSKFCFLSEKIAFRIYLYGSSIYGFAGLRRYKEKFSTYWEPRYLAYRNKRTFTMTIVQVTLLIQRAKKMRK